MLRGGLPSAVIGRARVAIARQLFVFVSGDEGAEPSKPLVPVLAQLITVQI